MRFWDASAVVPLISEQAASAVMGDLLNEDGEMAVWWVTWAECAVAMSRLARERILDEDDELAGRALLNLCANAWTEVEPTDNVRLTAAVLSQEHPLKTADAPQLAAALRWCGGDVARSGFVCLDNRLRRAASDEGFDVLPELQDDL